MARSYVSDKLCIQTNDESFYHAMAYIVNPEVWRKTKPCLEHLGTFKMFHKVLYSYTHKGLTKMIKNKALNTIFMKFMQDDIFIEFARSNETLREHFDTYLSAAQQMRQRSELSTD